MNETHSSAQPESRTNQIEEAAGRWLELHDFGGLTAEAQASFESWLSVSLAHRAAYVRLRSAWERTERLAALREPMRPAAMARRLLRPRLFRHVAILGIMSAVLGAVTLHFSNTDETRYQTAIGDREIITLADGSHVELNTDTILRAAVSANRRLVYLDQGEAYFDIKHDASHPFVVRSAHYQITDLGTEFVVRKQAKRFEVALVSGRARLDTTDALGTTQSTIFTPGDVAIADTKSVAITKKVERAIAAKLGWRRGVLVFDNTTLADAVSEINRYNREQIIVSDPSIARLTLVGTFPANDLELVLAAATDVYGLHASRSGDKILLHR